MRLCFGTWIQRIRHIPVFWWSFLLFRRDEIIL